jgi:hypothetical protein
VELLVTGKLSAISSQLAAFILLLALVGCHTPRPEQADLGERVDQEAFLHEHLPRQAMVTVAEAYRAMLVLADGEDPYTSFEEREAALLERGIARRAWGLEREEPIDRGSAAFMITRILKIRGGVNLAILGGLGIGDRRYAVRELVWLGMLAPAPPYRYMTGSELVDVLAKADAYMAERGMYVEERTDIIEMMELGEVRGER